MAAVDWPMVEGVAFPETEGVGVMDPNGGKDMILKSLELTTHTYSCQVTVALL